MFINEWMNEWMEHVLWLRCCFRCWESNWVGWKGHEICNHTVMGSHPHSGLHFLFQEMGLTMPPYREIVMIVIVSQCLVQHSGCYHPSPSVHPGPRISLKTQPGWEDAWEARAACPTLGHCSLVPGGENWLHLHHVIHLFSGHTPGARDWDAWAPAAAGSSYSHSTDTWRI